MITNPAHSVSMTDGSAIIDRVREQRPDHEIHIPRSVRRHVKALLNQQFWLWGCDVRRAEGNLLLQLGFDKIKAPPESGVTISQYTCPLCIRSTISLWGFGLCLRHDELGAIFIPRAGLRPQYAANVTGLEDAWEPAWFDRMHEPVIAPDLAAFCQLTLAALAWIGWYEQRILEIAGPEYRRRSLAGWPKALCTADDLAIRWHRAHLQLRQSFAGPPAGSTRSKC